MFVNQAPSYRTKYNSKTSSVNLCTSMTYLPGVVQSQPLVTGDLCLTNTGGLCSVCSSHKHWRPVFCVFISQTLEAVFSVFISQTLEAVFSVFISQTLEACVQCVHLTNTGDCVLCVHLTNTGGLCSVCSSHKH